MRAARFHWLAGLLMGISTIKGCDDAKLRSYVERLDCGMTLLEVERIVDVEIRAVGDHRLGEYRANFGRDAVWMDFTDDRLTSATAQMITGLTSARLSPKKNLCTGELTYFVSLEWIAELQEVDVFLNGQLIAEKATSGLVLEVNEGEHLIRLEKSGIAPIERKLVLDEDSFGDQWIDFEDFEPVDG